tara:strand:+ start:706 stop:1161 length:456 start_codon:yes stop_codon:yes gene_type:complete
MINFHYLKFFKYILSLLVIYNIISLLVLFLPLKDLKNIFWKFSPYDYSYLIGYPNSLNDLSLLTLVNRKEIKEKLIINESRNILNIEYWNYNLIIDNYAKNQNKDFEKSFLNLFLLTKNNKNKQLDLKKYFISNFNFFSEKNKKFILKNIN